MDDLVLRLVPRLPARIVTVGRNAGSPALTGLPMIGETGFEPATARPPAGCATRLRHSPWCYVPERATGIEPALEAWKASVQPQHFARRLRADDTPGDAAAGSGGARGQCAGTNRGFPV